MAHELIDANSAFYRAIRRGDFAAMDRLWSRARTVTCTHPGWTLLSGRQAVMDSWRAILVENEPLDIWPSDPMPIVTGSTGMVVCREQLGGTELIASNAFVLEGEAWRLINHQSAQIPLEHAR
ncbi:MAG: nuclear transport factor 2 family protein [Paracoccaceae bacterium]